MIIIRVVSGMKSINCYDCLVQSLSLSIKQNSGRIWHDKYFLPMCEQMNPVGAPYFLSEWFLSAIGIHSRIFSEKLTDKGPQIFF